MFQSDLFKGKKPKQVYRNGRSYPFIGSRGRRGANGIFYAQNGSTVLPGALFAVTCLVSEVYPRFLPGYGNKCNAGCNVTGFGNKIKQCALVYL